MRRNRALAGTLATAFLIMGGRWAAYIGAEPVFLTDVLFFGAVIYRLLSWQLFGKSGPIGVRSGGHQGLHMTNTGRAHAQSARSCPTGNDSGSVGLVDRPDSVLRLPRVPGPSSRLNMGASVLALGTWAIARMVLSQRYDVTAMRDFAPYLYIGAALLSAHAYGRSGPDQRNRTVQLLYYALLLHLAWVLAAILIKGLDQRMPTLGSNGVRLFSIRSDFDGAVLGVLAAYSLWMVLMGRSRRWHALVLLLSGALIINISSRAGLLSAIAGMSISAWAATRRSAGLHPRRRVSNVLAIGGATIVLLLALPLTVPGSRLIATIHRSATETTQEINSQGTTDARKRGWSKLQHYIEEDVNRQTIGVGFGPDFMSASGADLALLGKSNETVRSPHNYLLGTYARLGIIGAFLWLCVVAQLAKAVVRAIANFGAEPLLLFASLIVVGFILAGMLGVVLESPFGAIPFYWAGGILLSNRRL